MEKTLERILFSKTDNKMYDIIADYTKKIAQKQEEIFTVAMRTLAVPPIKGEITKGKVRWRGIRIIYQNGFPDSYTWLEQRGVQISPKIKISGSFTV